MKTSLKIRCIRIILLALGGAAFQSCGHVAEQSVDSVQRVSGNGGGYEGTFPVGTAPEIFEYLGSCADATISEARIRKDGSTYVLEVWNCAPLQPSVSLAPADVAAEDTKLVHRGRVYTRVFVP